MTLQILRSIYDSDLAPHLKPVAACLALFGDADGMNIFPSVDRVAWMLSRKDPRSVQLAIAELRALTVLVPITDDGIALKPVVTTLAEVPTNLRRYYARGSDGRLHAGTGGRCRTTRYFLNAEALPNRPGWREGSSAAPSRTERVKLVSPFKRVKPSTERVKSGAERVNSATGKGGVGFTRSTSDRIDRPDNRGVGRVEGSKVAAPPGKYTTA
jgi:hypothetical protein